MKKLMIIATMMFVMSATAAYASSTHWKNFSGKTEMGEPISSAFVDDVDEDANARVAVSVVRSEPVIFVYLYDILPSFGSNSVKFRVDKNEPVTLSAERFNADENTVGLGCVLTTDLVNQLMHGNLLKVKVDSMKEGYVVIDFVLKGSMDAIGEVLSNNI